MLTAASLIALWGECQRRQRAERRNGFAIITRLAEEAETSHKQGRKGEVNSAVSDGKTIRMQ